MQDFIERMLFAADEKSWEGLVAMERYLMSTLLHQTVV